MTKLEIANALIELANKICEDDDLEVRHPKKVSSEFKGKSHPTVDRFVADELEITYDRRDQMYLEDAYKKYGTWCDAMGVQHEMINARDFSAAMQAAGIDKARFNDGMRYIGIKKV